MSVALISTTDPDVLQNKGVPIELVKTRSDGQANFEAHPHGETETHWVKFTNARLRDLEKRFGTLKDYEAALEKKMIETLIVTLSMTLKDGPWPEGRVAEALAFGKLKDYSLAVSAAYGMALGRDPKVVKQKLLGMGAGWDETDSPTSGTDSWETTGGSSGPTSGPDGWATDTPATSSGTSVSDSSSPSSSPWP